MAAAFVPARFETLQRTILGAVASPARVAGSNEWFVAIDRARAELVDFARPRPPSDAERREIEGGKVTIEGVAHSLNADFAQQTLLLARTLQVSERYAASLLQAGLAGRARWGRGAVEVACILYHRERLALISCLKELVRGAMTLPHEDDAAARKLGAQMLQLAESLVATEVELSAGSKAKGSFTARVLQEIDAVKKGIQTLSASNEAVGASESLEMMHRERRELGHLLYLCAVARLLPTEFITACVNWLADKSEDKDALTFYILTTLLALLEPVEGRDFDIEDSDLIKLNKEIVTRQWALPELQSVAQLQWSLLIATQSFGSVLQMTEDKLQTLVIGAIAGSGSAGKSKRGDAFVFLVTRALAFRQRAIDAVDGEDEVGEAEASQPSFSAEEEVDAEFQEYILTQVQDLVLRVTSVMLPFLRKLQRAEEDAAFSPHRSALRSGGEPQERRYDIEALFDLVALLCRGRPEAGLPFWLGPAGKGTRFLAWAVDVREHGHQRALLEMLAALAAGPQSAWHAHSLLSSDDGVLGHAEGRLVSWTRLFEWMQYYIDAMRGPGSTGRPSVGMPAEEVVLLRAFLRLLRNVAFYSTATREAIYENTNYAAIQRLFSLYMCFVPLELKAAILDTLAAFAQPSGSSAARIVGDLWSMLEALQVIGPSGGNRGGASRLALGGGGMFGLSRGPAQGFGGGVVQELENVEVPNRRYPATTSFVNFLRALVHVPSPARDATGLLAAPEANAATFGRAPSSFQSLVLSLGQGHRTPGLDPYVAFVVDTVLLQASSRDTANATDMWRIKAACLGFIERCLVSYDLIALTAETDNGRKGSSDPATVTGLLLHPAFNLMKRLLTNTSLLKEIFNIIAPSEDAGFELINSNRARTLFQASCVRHAMRIVQRVLRIQDLFLQVLLPICADAAGSGSSSIGGGQFPSVDVAARVGQLGAYNTLDTHLLHEHRAVVQIALYINCQRDDIALLSVRLLGLIARSAAFSALDRFGEMGYGRKMNRLVGLLDMMSESDRVRAGYVERLEAEGADDVGAFALESLTSLALEEDDPSAQLGGDLEGLAAPQVDASETIRLAILDLLLANTTQSKASPNVAHLILGFDLRASADANSQVIPDPDSPDTPRGTLHSILAMLRPASAGSVSLADRAPALAEKCQALVAQLCKHPFSSAATLRYLRTREDFYVKQLRSAAFVPAERSTGEGVLGEVVFADGGRLASSVDALIASLRTRAHLLDGVALELHTLSNGNMQAAAARLVAVLFGTSAVSGVSGLTAQDDEDESLLEDDGYLPSQGAQGSAAGFEQRGLRILELLQSLDFEWHDEREALGAELSLLANIDIAQARRPDGEALREFDVGATLALLGATRRELERRGEMVEPRQRAAFEREAAMVLQFVSARNALRAIAHARRTAMQAWRHALDMVLARAAHLFRPDMHGVVVFDCLAALLPRLSGPSPEADPALGDLVAGAVLGLLTSLRLHRASTSSAAAALETDGPDELPIDRLVTTLRALLAALVRPGTSILARGNLYTALINYLQLVRSDPSAEGDGAALDNMTDDAGSVSFIDGDFDDAASLGGSVSARLGTSSVAETRTRALVASHLDRLVPILARDALDAIDIWRTVVYTLCDKLSALETKPSRSSGSSGPNARALEILSRQGFLKTFVAGLRDMDMALQEVLRPDPSSLNALYVYGAQLAFFSRLAQSRAGAERLIEARIFEVLAQADHLSARPEQDQHFVDLDSFLPAAMERYDALLTPALQLCVATLSSTSQRHARALAPASAKANGAFSSSSSAPRQALAFIEAHRTTLLTVLKVPTADTTSLAAISQAQLLVAMFVFILPALDDDALAPGSPLAGFHSAVLALAASFLHVSAWRERVLPQTEAEREDATRIFLAPGQQGAMEEDSVFDTSARVVVGRLTASLLAYLELASETRGRPDTTREAGAMRLRVRPCLTAALQAQGWRGGQDRYDDETSRFGAGGAHLRSAGSSVPGLGSCLAALEEQVTGLDRDLQGIDSSSAMLEQPDAVTLQEWDEIVRDVLGSEELELSLGPAQRRTLAIRELKQRRILMRSSALAKLDGVELLLVLLYRHFEYYLSLPPSALRLSLVDPAAAASRRAGSTLFSASTRGGESVSGIGSGAAANSSSSSNDQAALVRDGLAMVSRVLERLEPVLLELANAPLPRAKERCSFIQMAGRRLVGTLQQKAEQLEL